MAIENGGFQEWELCESFDPKALKATRESSAEPRPLAPGESVDATDWLVPDWPKLSARAFAGTIAEAGTTRGPRKPWPVAPADVPPIMETRRENDLSPWCVGETGATVEVKVGGCTQEFRTPKNYDGRKVADVLEDMAKMLRAKEQSDTRPRSLAQNMLLYREHMERSLMSAMRLDPSLLGKPASPAPCDHCGGQPQRWDTDTKMYVDGGECGHCGAGKCGAA